MMKPSNTDNIKDWAVDLKAVCGNFWKAEIDSICAKICVNRLIVLKI
jgi:hypothetical protein